MKTITAILKWLNSPCEPDPGTATARLWINPRTGKTEHYVVL